ncbi:carbonic anhydrase [Halosegnis sp.]|uniref:carbonic anhydrase n=1 Tax=Halosegnis sp. TaxID=2864959 RepID=UPI0035D47B59
MVTDTVVDLLAGNEIHAGEFADRFDDLQAGQQPEAVTISCSDSRVLHDRMWDNDTPGRLFTCGNIGNRVVQQTATGETVSGDVLYPLEHTGTETAIIVGHTGCGAVTATYDALTAETDVAQPPGIEHCINLLRPHLAPGVDQLPSDLDRAAAINHLVEYNVDQQVRALVTAEEVADDVTVVGAVYDFQDIYGGRRGEVHIINVGGERDPSSLRNAHPEIVDRITRLWPY